MNDNILTSVFKNADEMKIITREAIARLEENEIFDVMSEIAAAAENGRFFATFSDLYPLTKCKLVLLGYKVEQYKQVDNYYYKVGWC